MVYFVGVGGIGMSSLARYFCTLGKKVSGYDLTATKLTASLEMEGIEITYTDSVNTLPGEYLKESSKDEALVVYTPAIPSDNNILQYFKSGGFRVVKRSQILGELVNDARGIAVAGTHGKTSVSSLIAHLLMQTPEGCNGFLGGVAKNYNSNLLVSPQSDLVVVEADEYDRSFLQLFPCIAVITSMDPDHLDIYGNFENMKQAFSTFASQVRKGGTIICKKGLDLIYSHNNDINFFDYGIDQEADFYAHNIRISGNGLPVFDLVAQGRYYSDIRLGVPGRFNIENSVAAAAVAILCGAGEQAIREGLSSFSGIVRRFEIIINSPDCVLIDDYAHHPAELRASISAVKEIFPGRKVTGVFQPHLYSRTRDFAAEFAESLGILDDVILLDIYPARELPLPGVTSEMIFRQVDRDSKIMCSRDQLPGMISGMHTDVVIMLGAGNIDVMVDPVAAVLTAKIKKS